MESILLEKSKPKKRKDNVPSVMIRYDTRVDIARYVTRNITSMTDRMIRDLVDSAIDPIVFHNDRKKR